MQLKVNNCGECPLKKYNSKDDNCTFYCQFKKDVFSPIHFCELPNIKNDCTINNGQAFEIKTEPIKIKEYEN